MRATDDLGYAQVAMSLVRGDESPLLFHQANHHEARLGVIVPLVGVFFAFGPGNVSMALLPLLCTVLTAALVAWLAYRAWGEAAGLVAGILYALLPLTIGLSTFYVPEPLATLELSLAAACFLAALEDGPRRRIMELATGTLVGLAYLTTEVGALMLPVLLLYLVLKGKLRSHGAWLVAGFLSVLGAELAYHAAAHGSALYRFTMTSGYTDDPMVRGTNTGDLAYRLLKAYPSMFVYPNTDFGLLGPLLVLGGVYGVWKWREASLFVVWAAAILLFYNFMTASFSRYVALPVASRLLAPACVPLVVLAGKLAVDLWGWAGRAGTTGRYAGRTVYVAAAVGAAGVSLVAMYLGSAPTLTAAIARNAESVAALLREHPAVTLVTDPPSAKAIQFYRHYEPRDAFMGFAAAGGSADLEPSDGKPVFVVLNGPVVNEDEISGHLYGGGLSLSPGDRGALARFLPGPGTNVQSVPLRMPRFFPALLTNPVVRYLLGSYGYRLAVGLAGDDPPLAAVQVFRYDRTRHGPDPVDAMLPGSR
jgi:hypothetical protein